MTRMRKEPFKELYQLRDEFNRVMVTPFTKMMQGYSEFPRVDVFEREAEIVLRFDIPGIQKEDLDIRVDRDSITIKGKREEDQEQSDESYLYRERNVGEFARTILLEDHVIYEESKASYNNGILEIRVPKEEKEKGKKLQLD